MNEGSIEGSIEGICSLEKKQQHIAPDLVSQEMISQDLCMCLRLNKCMHIRGSFKS